MKKIILIAAILLGALTNGQAQVINKNAAKRIGEVVKEGYQDVKGAIVQDTKPTGEHTIWDIYAAPKVGLNLSNLLGVDNNFKLGAVAGAYVEVFVAKNLAIDVEMQYSHQGGSGIYRNINATDDYGNPIIQKYGPYNVNLHYINTNYIVRWYPWADLPWSFTAGVHTGYLISGHAKRKNGENINLEEVEATWLNKLNPIFPYKLEEKIETYDIKNKIEEKKIYKSSVTIAKPRVIIAAFPGTNSEYDMYNRFNENGGEAKITLLRNLTQKHLVESVDEMCKDLRNSQIFVLPGGFSAGDEPDGSGKFMAAVLQNPKLMDEIKAFLDRDGLILGVCNGFQALVKSGLLPYGEIGNVHENSPTLTFNKIGRHISQIVKTKIVTNNSPWLSSFEIGETFDIPVSHGEGRFYASDEVLKQLFENGQIATQYVNFDLEATNEFRFNPNGSSFAIEGIISSDGRIFGKMGHSERYSRDTFKNIDGNKNQNLILNGIKYFK